MMPKRSWTGACLALSAGLLLVSGCSRKPKTQIDAQKCVGTWLEVTDREDPGFPGRYVPPEETPEQIRRLTIRPDGTFELVLCKPDGTPIEGQQARGMWKAQGSKLVFEVQENQLPEDQRARVPQFTREPVQIETQAGAVVRLRMVDEAGDLVIMKPEG